MKFIGTPLECSNWILVVTVIDFFKANSIEDAEKQRAVFLYIIGPAPYKLLRNLISPAKPDE